MRKFNSDIGFAPVNTDNLHQYSIIYIFNDKMKICLCLIGTGSLWKIFSSVWLLYLRSSSFHTKAPVQGTMGFGVGHDNLYIVHYLHSGLQQGDTLRLRWDIGHDGMEGTPGHNHLLKGSNSKYLWFTFPR